MNKIDDILEILKGQRPVISDPDELTDRIMDSLPDIGEATGRDKAPVVRLRWWMAIAASLIIIIGIGAIWMFDDKQPETQLIAVTDTVDAQSPIIVADCHSSVPLGSSKKSVKNDVADCKSTATHKPSYKAQQKSPTADVPVAESTTIAESNPNLHYAVNELAKDTIPYQDPSRVDDFIAKFAANYGVKQGELTCSVPLDSNIVSTVYVFPDKKEIDVFARLLQVACWYNCETPGYFLNFSQQQFFFQLKDIHKQLQYSWITERINGKILLFGTNAPIGTDNAFVCYQEYRNELMNIKRNNTKSIEI